MSPGVVRAGVRNPNMSPNGGDTGRLVSFARSGTTGSRCRDRSVMPSAPDLRHCRRADSIRQATHIQEPEKANDLNGPRIANMYFVQTLTVASSGRRGMAH
jgi:hypothetical protein